MTLKTAEESKEQEEKEVAVGCRAAVLLMSVGAVFTLKQTKMTPKFCPLFILLGFFLQELSVTFVNQP